MSRVADERSYGPGVGRVSLQAELLRVALRHLVKNRDRSSTLPAEARQWGGSVQRWVPRPPADTRTTAVRAGGVPGFRIVTPESRSDRHILFLHGGAFVLGSSKFYRHVTWRIASAARASLLTIDYRLAPEHRFPAALDDAIAAYRWLLADRIDARRIALVGDSAGGNLAFALLLKARDEGLPLPAAAVGLSPWLDLALESPSFKINAEADPLLHVAEFPRLVRYYLESADPRTPYASPVYGDLSGLPPTLIQVGSDEILRDDSVRAAEKIRASGGECALEIWPRMPHDWHLFAPVLPEARAAIARIGDFLQRRL
jgi:acetyl esterase/lipase